jgi:hypothetical protein
MADKQYEFISGAKRSAKVPGVHRIVRAFLRAVAVRGDIGEMKYGHNNYRQGLEDREFVQQLFAHAIDHLVGEAEHFDKYDEFKQETDGDGDELGAVGWGIMALVEAREVWGAQGHIRVREEGAVAPSVTYDGPGQPQPSVGYAAQQLRRGVGNHPGRTRPGSEGA